MARLMDQITGEVRALLQERQDARKARLDPGRRDVSFSPGDEVLVDTSHTPLPSRTPLSPRWMGPFSVLTRTAPNTYRLAVPPTWRAFDEFNVQFLRRYVRRPAALGGEAPPPAPVVGANGQVEHEVAEIQLRFSSGPSKRRPPTSVDPVGWARRLRGHVGTLGPSDQLRRGDSGLRVGAGGRPPALSPCAAFRRVRRRATPRPSTRIHGGGGAGPPGGRASGPVGVVLVARGRLAAPTSSARWIGCVVAHLSLML